MDAWYDRQQKVDEEMHILLTQLDAFMLAELRLGEFRQIQDWHSERHAHEADVHNAKKLLHELEMRRLCR